MLSACLLGTCLGTCQSICPYMCLGPCLSMCLNTCPRAGYLKPNASTPQSPAVSTTLEPPLPPPGGRTGSLPVQKVAQPEIRPNKKCHMPSPTVGHGSCTTFNFCNFFEIQILF